MQLPIYIAQKNISVVLGWQQTDKGIIFLCWRLSKTSFQYFSADLPIGSVNAPNLYLSFIIVATSYFILPLQHEFTPMLLNMGLLGFGTRYFQTDSSGNDSPLHSIAGIRLLVGEYIL